MEYEKHDDIISEVDSRRDFILSQYPNLDPKIAETQAWKDTDGKMKIGLLHAKNIAISPMMLGIFDLILKRDSEGAAAVWSGFTGTEKYTFIDLAMEREWGASMDKYGEAIPWTGGLITYDVIPLAIGLALDIGLDPINYIPWVGAMKWAGKGIKVGGKLLSKVGIVNNMKNLLIKSSVGNLLKKAVNLGGEKFIPRYGVPKEFADKIVWAVRNQRWEEVKIMRQAAKFYKRIEGADDVAVSKLMTYVRQHPGDLYKLSTKNQKLLKEIGDEFVNIGQKAVDAKLISKESFNKLKETYIWGYYPEYTRLIGKGLPPSKFQRFAKSSFAQPKHFTTIEEAKDFAKSLGMFDDVDTMAEARRIAEKFRSGETITEKVVDAVTGEVKMVETPVKSFLENAFQYLDNVDEVKSYTQALQASHTPVEDLIKLYVGYTTQVKRAIAADTFITSTLRDYGHKVRARFFQGVVPKGKSLFLDTAQLRYYPGGKKAQAIVDELVKLSKGEGTLIEMSDEVAKLVGKLEAISLKHVGVTKNVNAYLIDDIIAKQLNRTGSLMFNDNVAKPFLRFMDKTFGWWKTLATSARLPFHSRNVYSSAMMNFFDGMEIHEMVTFYSKATKLGLGVGMDGSLIVKATGKAYKYSELWEEAGKRGVMGTGWIGHINKPLWKQLDLLTRTGRIKSSINPLEWGRKIGSVTEDQARLAKFLERVSKGDSFDVAAKRVFATHYDYSSLGFTEFETTVMKRVIPFYGWWRNNTPRMAYILTHQPGKVATVGKVQRALYNLNPQTREERLYAPDYFEEQMWTKAPDSIAKAFGGDKTIYLKFDTPLTDLIGPGELVLGNPLPLQQQLLNLINPWGLKAYWEALSVYFTDKGTGIETFPRVGPVQSFPGQKTPAPWFLTFFPEWLQEKAGIGVYTDLRTGKKVVGMPKWAKKALYGAIPVARELEKLHPNPVDVEVGFSPWRQITLATGVNFTPVNVEEQKFWAMRDAMEELQMWMLPFLQNDIAPTKKEKEEMLRSLGYTEARIKKVLKGFE